jgi:putative transposase
MSELDQDGNKKVELKRSKPHQDKDDMMSNPIPIVIQEQLELQLFTPELVLKHNNQTLIDKSQPLQTFTQKQKLSVKLEEDLTSNAKSFSPYWNESCKEMSNALLSHIKTDWQDSDSTFINGSVTSLTAQSWFSTKQTYLQKQKWLKISSPSSTVSQVDYTASENIKLRCNKIRIYPSQELAIIWNKWIAACRYCFNQALAYQKKKGKTSKLNLRNLIMQSDLPAWVKETPCHIRQNAIFDAHQAYSASSKCSFRSCKSPRQTIKFNDKNYSQGTWYSRLTKNLKFLSTEPVPLNSNFGTQLVKMKGGQWFGIFLEEIKPKENNLTNIIAIDPGVRTFLTGCDGQSFIEIGKSDIGRITRLCQHLDNLISRIAKSNTSRQRQKMRKAAGRIRQKIRNLIDECHKQAAAWLTNNYKIVLLPVFESAQMTNKTKRKIKSKTARQMLTWAHYRFKQVIKNKAELSGCQVIDVTEEFTSKTCTNCGHVHQTLGGNKLFKCPECGHSLNRDFNGALGILLKALRDTSIVRIGNALVVQYDNVSDCTA